MLKLEIFWEIFPIEIFEKIWKKSEFFPMTKKIFVFGVEKNPTREHSRYIY